MDEFIDSIGDALTLYTLDANRGYWTVEMEEAYCHKSAFASHHGLFRFLKMLFVLRNAPGTYQRVMDVILSPKKRKFALLHFDDISI